MALSFRICPRCGASFPTERDWLLATYAVGADRHTEPAPALKNGTPVEYRVTKPYRAHRNCGGQMFGEGRVRVDILWSWKRRVAA